MRLQRTWSSEPFLANITLVPLWSGRYGFRTESGHHGLRRWDRWRSLLSWWWLWSIPIRARWQQVTTIGVPSHRDRVILWRWWQSWWKAGPVMLHAISIITYRSLSVIIHRGSSIWTVRFYHCRITKESGIYSPFIKTFRLFSGMIRTEWGWPIPIFGICITCSSFYIIKKFLKKKNIYEKMMIIKGRAHLKEIFV